MAQARRGGSAKASPKGRLNLRELVFPVLLVLSGWTSFAALPVVTGSNTGRVIAMFACAALWLAAWSFGLLPGPGGRRLPLLLAVAACGAVVVLASALPPYSARALTWGSIGFFGAPVWIALLVIGWGASRMPLDAGRRIWLAGALSWLVPSLVLAFGDLLLSRPVAGGFNTGNQFTPMMALAVPLALWLARASRSRAGGFLWGVVATCAALGVAVASSAAGYLGLGVTLVLMAFVAPGLLVGDHPRAVRWVRAGVGGVAGLATLAVISALAVPGRLPGFLVGEVRTGIFGPTWETRLEMWKAAARAMREYPLLGVGADGFHLAAQPFFSDRMFSIEPIMGILSAPPDPHSFPVLIGVSFGVLGLIAAGALAIAWVHAVLRTEKTMSHDERMLPRATMCAIAGFFAAMLFLPWAAILGAFPAVVVGSAAAVSPADTGRRPTLVGRLVALGGALAFLALGGMLLLGVTRLDNAVNVPRAEEALPEYRAAAGLIPTYPYPRFMALHLRGERLGSSGEQLAAWQREVDADAQIHEDATYSLLLVRDSLDQAYRWGRDDLSWDEALLTRAVEQFPAAIDATLEQAHLALLQGDVERASAFIARLEQDRIGGSRVTLYRYYVAVAREDGQEVEALRQVLQAEYGPWALLEPQ